MRRLAINKNSFHLRELPRSLILKVPLRVFAILLMVMLQTQAVCAQNLECQNRLEQAQELYNNGVFEEIPELLYDCLPELEQEERQRAYKLIIMAQYLNDEIIESEETMLRLLKEYPEFKPEIDDLADFQFLYKSYRIRNFLDVGFSLETLVTWGRILEPWSLFDEKIKYSIKGPGIAAGIYLNFPIKKNFSINTIPSFSTYSFQQKRDHAIQDILIINQVENHQVLKLPLYIRYKFLEKQIQPYVKLGFVAAYLHAATIESDLQAVQQSNGDIIFSTEPTKRDHLANRNQYNYMIGGGIGAQYKLNKLYIFSEINYHHSFQPLLKNGSNRYEQYGIWSEGWIDSDFQLIHLSLRLGIAYSFYHIKKVR